METKIQKLIRNNFKSQLNGSMNNIVRHIKDIKIDRMPETEVIELSMDTGKVVFIDTNLGVHAKTRHALLTAKKKYYYHGGQTRETITFSLPEYNDNTRINLASVIAICDELDRGFCKQCYCGFETNHKDLTGNVNRFGYSNNRIYNLEITNKYDNEIHRFVIEKLNKIYDRRFSVSAENYDLINVVRYCSDDEIRQYLDSLAIAGHVKNIKGIAVID